MIGNIFGSDGLIVVMIAVVVLFGGSQLPKFAKNIGSAGHEFRKAQREAEAEHATMAAEHAAVIATTASVPVPTAVPPAIVPVPVTPDSAPLSRSELRQELAKLLQERDTPGAG